MSEPAPIKDSPQKTGQKKNWDDFLKTYYDKPQSLKTWSGFDVKEIYTPKDRKDQDYKESIGDAGAYPFTRGIHRDMFRGRYWTRREVVGIGSPADTHERAAYCFKQGAMGMNTIADITYEMRLSAGELAEGKTVQVVSEGPEGQEMLKVKIPPGSRPGSKLRLRGKGKSGENGRGDLYLKLEQLQE